MCVNGAEAQFYYKADGGWQPLGGVQPADHLSDDYVETRRGRCAFTGAMVGICAQDMDAHQSHADFAFLTTRNSDEKRNIFGLTPTGAAFRRTAAAFCSTTAFLLVR